MISSAWAASQVMWHNLHHVVAEYFTNSRLAVAE